MTMVDPMVALSAGKKVEKMAALWVVKKAGLLVA